MVDDRDYLEGYVQGFKAVMGASRPLPSVPPQPANRPGRTAFQMGLIEGFTKGCQCKGIQAPAFVKPLVGTGSTPAQPATQLRSRMAR